jgi:hypothetical protein
MLRLTGNVGELLQATEQRLIRYGCTEREAVERTSTDSEVEAAVIEALVSAKPVDGVTDIEYLGGQRRDTLRLEGR